MDQGGVNSSSDGGFPNKKMRTTETTLRRSSRRSPSPLPLPFEERSPLLGESAQQPPQPHPQPAPPPRPPPPPPARPRPFSNEYPLPPLPPSQSSLEGSKQIQLQQQHAPHIPMVAAACANIMHTTAKTGGGSSDGDNNISQSPVVTNTDNNNDAAQEESQPLTAPNNGNNQNNNSNNPQPSLTICHHGEEEEEPEPETNRARMTITSRTTATADDTATTITGTAIEDGFEWTLQVRSFPSKLQKRDPQNQESQQQEDRPGRIVCILIAPSMTEARLGKCILQAASAATSTRSTTTLAPWMETEGSFSYSNVSLTDRMMSSFVVTGLFRELDELFVPLEQILSRPLLYKESVWTLDPSSCSCNTNTSRTNAAGNGPRSNNGGNNNNLNTLAAIGAATVAAVASVWYYVYCQEYQYYDSMKNICYQMVNACFISAPIWIINTIIHHPLKEMYRHGPQLVGWEGARLAKICARITYHGDEDFWSRNLEECERIFAAKEEAFLKMTRPLVYALVAISVFQVLRSLVSAYAEHRYRYRPDPDMVETYRAFNMLMKQTGRAIQRGSAATTRTPRQR